ncbi:MAG: hypothetical protein XD91_1264 [Clostridiales bacterium 38_11]|nr:MAG: hypothetical protein XD91_1264 [Clostridiales bacterium 38_11]HBH12207.1 hypothetical protein [Clostridiales bacterium]
MKYNRIEKTYNSFKREEFIDYFSNIGSKTEESFFQGDGWGVFVGEEERRQFKTFDLTSVKLTISVREDIQDQFIKKLMISFLKGGG